MRSSVCALLSLTQGSTRETEALEGRFGGLQGYAPNHELMVCLGHSTNFRYGVYPSYKSNRRGIQKAACYSAFRAYVQSQYSNTVLPGVEADDVLGLMYRPGDLLYSPDKDLRTISGDHLLANGEVMPEQNGVVPFTSSRNI